MAAKKKAAAFSFGKDDGAPWQSVAPFITDACSVRPSDWPYVWSLPEADRRRAIARGRIR